MHETYCNAYIDRRKTDVSLNGIWRLASAPVPTDTPETLDYSVPAQVPGTVAFALYRAGVMPHPYQNDNCVRYAELDRRIWYYTTTFTAPAAEPGGAVLLCFEGVAYRSRVWLNGQLLGAHNGHQCGPIFDITAQVQAGQPQTLTVEVTAATYGMDPREDVWKRAAESDTLMPWGELRDNACGNGCFTPIGIWRDVRLCCLPPVHISRPFLHTTRIDGEGAHLRLQLEVCDEAGEEVSTGLPWKEMRRWYSNFHRNPTGTAGVTEQLQIRVTLTAPDGTELPFRFPFDRPDRAAAYWETEPVYRELVLFEAEMTVPEPVLWFPHGLGEPALYTCRIELYRQETRLDSLRFRTGIRTVEVVPTETRRFSTLNESFRYRVNGRDFFVKGVNWQPLDPFWELSDEGYDWNIRLLKNEGIQLVRVWSGGGFVEDDRFYDRCDEAGLLVWQDLLMANSEKPRLDLDALDEQLALGITRIRNHASLAVYCGGNEHTPDQAGNQAAMYMHWRHLRYRDNTRHFYPATPYGGSMHVYEDRDAVWYRKLYDYLPFMAESGIHCYPSYDSLRQQIDRMPERAADLTRTDLWESYPQLAAHLMENNPQRIPQMFSRTGQLIDMETASAAEFCAASQLAAAEYYLIMAESLREKYPSCGGLLPWCFRRPWLTSGIQLVDGLGLPVTPYYYLKSAFAPVTAQISWRELFYAPGEPMELPLTVINESGRALPADSTVTVEVFSPTMERYTERRVTLPPIAAETYRTDVQTEPVRPDAGWTDVFLLVRVRLQCAGNTVSEKVYWPRYRSLLADETFRREYRTVPQKNIAFTQPPYLKNQLAAAGGATLTVQAVRSGEMLQVTVTNTGTAAAFPVHIALRGVSAWFGDDDSFLLDGGETRSLTLVWRSTDGEEPTAVCVSAWNAPDGVCAVPC